MNRYAPPSSARARALSGFAAAAVLATAAWLGSPTVAAAAQPTTEVRQTTIHYTLGDLASEPRTRALYRRIVSAAQSVCPGWSSQDLDEFAASMQCRREAVARAVRQIGNARLAAVHSQTLAHQG